MSETRKIAAILVADVVGYSRSPERMRIAPSRGFERPKAVIQTRPAERPVLNANWYHAS